MGNPEIFCDLSDLHKSNQLKDEIIQKWNELQNTPGIFKYKLNVRNEKILGGNFGFYIQLNPERARLRRVPQQIDSLNPVFDESKFNFNKANPEEKVVSVTWKNSTFTLLINQSPLTPYHCLICPRMQENIPQILNEEAIDFSLRLLAYLQDKSFRIGYNSPGALASVNHLHLHLLYIPDKLLIDRVGLVPIKDNIFKTSSDCPAKAVCFVFHISKKTLDYDSAQVTNMYKAIEMLCRENIPHNLFFTANGTEEQFSIKGFIFVREKPALVKDTLALNFAFCELSGYVPLGDEDLFDTITEGDIVSKIEREIGNVFETVEGRILSL